MMKTSNMTASEKTEKVESFVSELKALARRSLAKNNYEKALCAISSAGDILYQYNQRYKDDELEELLEEISIKTITVPENIRNNDKTVKTVLYYDGFGLDLRGTVIAATRAIAMAGYHLVYVTNLNAKGNQPHLVKELQPYHVDFVYIHMNDGYTRKANELLDAFREYCPEAAFYYTSPYDVAGIIVFNRLRGFVTRFFNDLTDHAFWLGVNTFDYILNNRTMGQSIQHYYRGIPVDKMLTTRGSLYVDDDIQMEELPFDTKSIRYVFSGGALYKTLGDPNKYFYKMIEHIVCTYDDVNFVYAGEGDKSEFQKLITKYPGRVFLFPERKDYYQLIQGCVFYLNTYPMFGGMMMRYACNAQKVHLTLRHEHESDGILYKQSEINIEVDTYEDAIVEINRLLSDENYRKKKESILTKTIFTKQEAADLYRDMIDNHHSIYPASIEEIDTSKFRSEYIERLDYKRLKTNCIAKTTNRALLANYPIDFIRKALAKVSMIDTN